MEELRPGLLKSLDPEKIPEVGKDESLAGQLIEMFQPVKKEQVMRIGDDTLLIKEIIYDWAGKTNKQIYDILLGKIQNWERIYDEFDYEAAEQQFNFTGGIDLVLKFVKRKIVAQ